MKLAGVATLGALLPEWAFAGPFQVTDFKYTVPPDKKLSAAWIRSLTARGKRTEYRGKQLEKIGMPIGGICAGGVYIGGDGRLWLWDIFNENKFGIMQTPVTYRGTTLNAGGGSAYVAPPDQIHPFDQGFQVKINHEEPRSLDSNGFKKIRFIGEYPIAHVWYDDHPMVGIELEAFSPFIPLNADDSSYPATLIHYTLHNKGADPVEIELTGWLQNHVCSTHGVEGTYKQINEAKMQPGSPMLLCRAEAVPTPPKRAELVVEDWAHDTYSGWVTEGTAFGSGPIAKSKIPDYQGDVGGPGDHVVNSHATAPGALVADKDGATGKMTSSPFTIQRNYLTFWIGGGNHPGKTCLNLLVDGKVVRSATGRDSNKMHLDQFPVKDLIGKEARLEIVDAVSGAWGNIGIGRILQSDSPSIEVPVKELPDFGSMALGVLAAGQVKTDWKNDTTGGVTYGRTLGPGESATLTFILAWHFPNLKLGIPDDTSGRYYATKFTDAADVVRHLAENHKELDEQTRLWHKTWYDSTLPYWFLDRTFANTSTLATTTAHRFGSGRFYAWEGIGCCAGTCTHVWHYAQAMGRIFPQLERDLRSRVDYGLAFNDETGAIGFRAEFDHRAAMDGQAGSVLRTYREHQMTADTKFLTNIWPKVQQSIEYMITFDKNVDGLLQGPQENTLDAAWYGKISWISSMYLAALKAGEEMALEIGDGEFAKRCQGIFQQGIANIDKELFNGEYYIQTHDPLHPEATGSYDCCHIDQVLGQGWAWQVGLGRVLTQSNTVSALRALYKYNFTPDVGPWRDQHKEGRWYAMPGDGGLVMTTNPKQETNPLGNPQAWQFGYFYECMSGFEHQAAGHMIAEGLVQEGLAVTKAIHDRYRADLRNPWNEIECSDHYARAMASYGSFIAICGFEHHGPKRSIGFAPRLTPEDFKAPFTCAEGWGTYAQKRSKDSQRCEIAMKSGQLQVQTLTFEAGPTAPRSVGIRLDYMRLEASIATVGPRTIVVLEKPATVPAGKSLTVWLNYTDGA